MFCNLPPIWPNPGSDAQTRSHSKCNALWVQLNSDFGEFRIIALRTFVTAECAMHIRHRRFCDLHYYSPEWRSEVICWTSNLSNSAPIKHIPSLHTSCLFPHSLKLALCSPPLQDKLKSIAICLMCLNCGCQHCCLSNSIIFKACKSHLYGYASQMQQTT